MQLNLVTILLIVLGCMFFGYFFGLFEGRGQGYKKRKEEEKGLTEVERTPAPPPAPVIKDDPGLLRLKEENGQLQVDLDGLRINGNTLAPEQRKRLIELVTRLRPWVEGHPAPPAGGSPPVSAPLSQPVGSASQDRSAPVPATAPSATTPKREAPTAPQSMVAQIDAILQEKIGNTHLGQRGIKLEEASGGTVNVVVGIQRYAGVGEVPDPEVQAAIRAAIAEWERKFTPGL